MATWRELGEVPDSEEDNDSLEQSRLKQTQQPSNAQDRAQQPIQQTTNGPTNRHLSEEDDAESTRQKGNNASEASDADDSDDEDEEDEEPQEEEELDEVSPFT